MIKPTSVEDAREITETLLANRTVVLNLEGLDVDIAANGLIALEMATSASYDLIFMDCQMPIMDGYTATTKLREWEPPRSLWLSPLLSIFRPDRKRPVYPRRSPRRHFFLIQV